MKPRIRTDRPSESSYRIENGRLRLDFDLRTEFPYYNFIWVCDESSGDYRRFCNIGVEAMPMPVPPPPDAEDPPPANVWLMGHDYKVKELQLSARRAQVQAAYPPPMVVVGELSGLSGARAAGDFPDWGKEYWNRVETMQCSIQAVFSLEAGQPWFDLQVRPALGDLISIMPMLLYGFCGHDDIPTHAYAGGLFLNAQAADGSWPSHFELFDGTSAHKAQLDLKKEQVFVFFGSRPESTAVVMALHEPHPEGFFFLGRNESAVDPENPSAYFADAARRAPYRPEQIHSRGFNEQTLFLEVMEGRPLPKVRIGIYPETPLEYGNAEALRSFIDSRSEIATLAKSKQLE